MYSQDVSSDSLFQASFASEVASQKKPLLMAHADLGVLLQEKYIKTRFPRKYARIIALKRKSFDFLVRIDQTKDAHEKIVYLQAALKIFNRAQVKYNTLISKKDTP
jgi:hypothetical protein